MMLARTAKSNEITTVPALLKMLSLKGTIVTADALDCHRAIAGPMIDQGDVRRYFDDTDGKTVSEALSPRCARLPCEAGPR